MRFDAKTLMSACHSSLRAQSVRQNAEIKLDLWHKKELYGQGDAKSLMSKAKRSGRQIAFFWEVLQEVRHFIISSQLYIVSMQHKYSEK